MKIEKKSISLQTYTIISKYWQTLYTGAFDMRNRTHKHPLKDVIHCGSYMHIATKARHYNKYVGLDKLQNYE